MSDIFVSYASKDRERVRVLVKALQAEGWTVWWDRRMLPGEKNFSHVIDQALDEAICVMVIWTAAAIESKWVHSEAAEGNTQNKLIPVMFENVRVPLEFRMLQAAQMSKWKGDKTNSEFQRLLASIRIKAFKNKKSARKGSEPVTKPAPKKAVVKKTLVKNIAKKTVKKIPKGKAKSVLEKRRTSR